MPSKKAVSLTDYAASKGRSSELPAPRPPDKPQPRPTTKPAPKPVPGEGDEPKPKIVNAEEEKRARMLDTLARARRIRAERLAAQSAQSAQSAQASHKGGSATSAPDKPESRPKPQPEADAQPEPEAAAPPPDAAKNGEVPTHYHPLPDHLEKKVRLALDEVRTGKVSAILVMFRED